jgi:acetyl esterase
VLEVCVPSLPLSFNRSLDSHHAGQLSVATTILCSTRSPKIPIAYQVLLHPVTDTVLTDNETRSEFLFFNGPVLTMPFTSNVIEDYIPKASDRQSELASPLKISAAHAKLQPPTLIINSSADLLRSEGSAFGEILQQQGIECVVLTGHGQVHDSEVLEATRTGPTPKLVIRVVVGEIVRVLGAKEEGKRKRTVGEESEEAEVEAESEGNEDQGTKTRKRKRTRGSS